ncbi:MAG: hypothetical protein Q4D04_06870 [Clostridia bacterium]|nr:hypothetical protein [Clostridia bacterium]
MRKFAAALAAMLLLCAFPAYAGKAAENKAAEERQTSRVDMVDIVAPIKPIKPEKRPPARAYDEDGDKAFAGTLKEVIRRVMEWDETDRTIYISASELLKVKGMNPEDVESVTFEPDPTVFDAGEYEVYVGDVTPKMARKNRKKKSAGNDLYVRVIAKEVSDESGGSKPEKPFQPGDEDGDAPSGVEIKVTAEGYLPGMWADRPPLFTLGGMPDDGSRYNYAAIAYDERFVILSGDSFSAIDEGQYSLSFAILDGIGDIVAASERYEVMLDFTPPVNIYVNMLSDSKKTFAVIAEDALSGIDAFSVDGGYSWHKGDEHGIFTHTSNPGYTFPAGAIMARDVAGNIAVYPIDFTLPAKTSSSGGGGGSSGTKVRHSPPGQIDFDPYDTLNLRLPGGEMKALIIDDTELPLTLSDEEGKAMSFTAEFAAWGNGEEGAASPDTLILTAASDSRKAVWTFNGVVYKMLANSGIEYLCFRHADGIAAVATEGFTSGTAYARLKAQGVSTRRFDYTITQNGSLADFSLSVINNDDEVEKYELTTDVKKEMYLHDAVVGTARAMLMPFGSNNEGEESL